MWLQSVGASSAAAEATAAWAEAAEVMRQSTKLQMAKIDAKRKAQEEAWDKARASAAADNDDEARDMRVTSDESELVLEENTADDKSDDEDSSSIILESNHFMVTPESLGVADERKSNTEALVDMCGTHCSQVGTSKAMSHKR